MKQKRLTYFSFIFLLIIAIDRYTKSLALHLDDEKIINSFLSFGLTFNRGINWGFFNGKSVLLYGVINTAIACVILILGWYTWHTSKYRQPMVGNILILAGAVSNYFDRLYYHGVIDFIVFSFGNWSWPAFNIADIAIVSGIGLMLLANYRKW